MQPFLRTNVTTTIATTLVRGRRLVDITGMVMMMMMMMMMPSTAEMKQHFDILRFSSSFLMSMLHDVLVCVNDLKASDVRSWRIFCFLSRTEDLLLETLLLMSLTLSFSAPAQ
jgi:hypothetical protein